MSLTSRGHKTIVRNLTDSAKKAIVAVARKLLVRCWGMLKAGKAWRNLLSAAVVRSYPGVGPTTTAANEMVRGEENFEEPVGSPRVAS